MPIIDGVTASKMIRELENKAVDESPLDGTKRNRISILAVLASIVEQDNPSYIEAGFDGWIMKPINFSRLSLLLDRVRDPSLRSVHTRLDNWESGEWFDIEA